MRIASGVLRNMPLDCPAGKNTRPTSDKIRQAILNSLTGALEGAHVLDLFAGTGAMGIEAISRGATGCTFVESDRETLRSLDKNVKEARRRFTAQGLKEPDIQIVPVAIPACLSTLSSKQPYHLIWLDPPYAAAISLFCASVGHLAGLLADDGIIAIESEKTDQAELLAKATVLAPSLQISKSKAYGRTGVTTWVKIG